MAKTKHQKSKPNKQSHSKKHGKQADISEFRAQLDALGLKIIQVTADGNCFFRSLGDQLEGNEEEHEKYRDMTVKFIRNNRDTFEPFIEDDVPFDEYCESMEKDGTWAGHMELQAASLVTHTNICIHRHMSPRWYIQNFDNRESRMLHLSYHDGEHYNSIRLKEDSCTGAPNPIIIKADADLSAKSREAIAAAKSKGDTGRIMVQVGSVKVVMAGSGCDNSEKVEQVLRQVGGDVDAATEFLIAEQGSEDQLNANDNFSCLESTSQGSPGEPDIKSGDSPCKKGSSDCSVKGASDKHTSQEDEKKIPRNKACPCGSKKKYKSCCGSVAGKHPTSYTVSHTIDYGKGRRDKKQGKKVPPVNVTTSKQSDARPPDMGALCI
ncbi:OVARIAN TUMOR DOMAIN-containing deubiquitinating enzyme 7 isoform X1 [Solanum dulcamara]|uniref:OVARIAN TUMOR DOMAIN-containing deubiquitinating enzyme 7 isoform X1 n=1 Tax=Solanum dulcamara TaxID=45834 RepID=UPI00248528DE|nr:OVARIAN TUMOR DOMAIN-containing deubiquitinating enzyme 7 isoform X1 [Solanum dulcamara]XP_055825621.1 OVARIAN TUMOR DOMAIN-containing deubiquitinating enzyme 7 isoform X1 [Solanum dulcamara]